MGEKFQKGTINAFPVRGRGSIKTAICKPSDGVKENGRVRGFGVNQTTGLKSEIVDSVERNSGLLIGVDPL